MENYLKLAKKLDWLHWVERPYLPFISTLAHSGVDKRYFVKVGLPGGHRAMLYQFPDIYYSATLGRGNMIALKRYLKKHSIFDISERLSKVHAANKKEMSRLTGNQGVSSLEKLARAGEIMKLYYPFLWILPPLEEYYDALVKKRVKRYIKIDQDSFIGHASIPRKKNVHSRMLAALAAGRSLKEVQSEFGWLKSRDGFTDFYSISELREIKKNHHLGKKVPLEIPKPLVKLVEEIRELAFFRTDRTDKYYEILGLARPILKEVAATFKISFADLKYYDAEMLLNGRLKRISTPFTFLYLDGEQYILDKPLIKPLAKLNAQVRGIIAFKGLVKGRVKIVVHPSQLAKVREGDVLVSQMTFPSFMSAMQKASAFVTDEGGITCHASIIARVMKRPCIIATKNATKILKDNDLVEVNANSGIVTVLKSGGKNK